MKSRKIIPLAFCLLIGSWLFSLKLTAIETNVATNQVETAEPMVVVSNVPEVEATNQETNQILTKTKKTATVQNWKHAQPIVLFGQNAELKADESAEAVVVIGGSATIHGRVREAVVVIGGNAEVDGSVGEAVVAVGGNVHLKSGAEVHEDVVSVLGTVSADSGAKVRGDTVAVGGKLELAPGASVKGNKVNVGFPKPFANVEWLRNWFRYCVFELRPLAFQVGFVWVIAAVFFLVYLFIAAIFARPVETSVQDLNQRPATIFLVGLLTKLLLPFVYLILAATGLGVIAVPLIGMTLFLLALFGKVAILEWIGFKVGRLLGGGVQKPLAAFILGTLMVTVIYLVPVIGMLAYVILGMWALGTGVMAVFGRARREAPEFKATPSPATSPSPTAAPISAMQVQPEPPTAPPIIDDNFQPSSPKTGETFAATGDAGGIPPQTPHVEPSANTPPVAADMATLPKANLWERLLAALLDIILIGLLAGFTRTGRYCPMVALAYFTVMWIWRGTTVGGVLLKLKVVRTDGRPVGFAVALVRGLAAAFSILVFFLGFLWIAWDQDKQGWHDKIAGTVVVRLPRSMPLVCL